MKNNKLILAAIFAVAFAGLEASAPTPSTRTDKELESQRKQDKEAAKKARLEAERKQREAAQKEQEAKLLEAAAVHDAEAQKKLVQRDAKVKAATNLITPPSSGLGLSGKLKDVTDNAKDATSKVVKQAKNMLGSLKNRFTNDKKTGLYDKAKNYIVVEHPCASAAVATALVVGTLTVLVIKNSESVRKALGLYNEEEANPELDELIIYQNNPSSFAPLV